MPSKSCLAIGLVVGLAVLSMATSIFAVDGDAVCKERKAKATGKLSASLLKAFGKNKKRPNVVKLSADLSKASSRFTKGFTNAEAPGECQTTGDAGQIKTDTDSYVANMLVQLCPPPSTTTTSTTFTTTTSGCCAPVTTTTFGAPDCGGIPPGCFGFCGNALACVDDGGACSCSGEPLPCGVVSAAGECGGTCPAGLICRLVSQILPDGCPGAPHCGCAP